MAGGEVYGSFEFSQKGYTRGTDIGRGQIGLPHVNPPLFLEMRLIKTHLHTGVDSQLLPAEATPYMVRGHRTKEREEKGTATWTGSAATSGSVALTYGTAFLETPEVHATQYDGNPDITLAISARSTTGCTITWKDLIGNTHTEVNIGYLIKGR